jgi:hypothetical protein
MSIVFWRMAVGRSVGRWQGPRNALGTQRSPARVFAGLLASNTRASGGRGIRTGLMGSRLGVAGFVSQFSPYPLTEPEAPPTREAHQTSGAVLARWESGNDTVPIRITIRIDWPLAVLSWRVFRVSLDSLSDDLRGTLIARKAEIAEAAKNLAQAAAKPRNTARFISSMRSLSPSSFGVSRIIGSFRNRLSFTRS